MFFETSTWEKKMKQIARKIISMLIVADERVKEWNLHGLHAHTHTYLLSFEKQKQKKRSINIKMILYSGKLL